MTYPWKGAARALSSRAFEQAARQLDCAPAALRAIWEVEAAGKGFRADGTLERRFEPHHMPGVPLGWRDSLKIPTAERERRFLEAWRSRPDAALRATSWGGPQIMGFNHALAGHASAEAMVVAMAESEQAQLDALVAFCLHEGLATMIRAHDWQRFAARYNGTGQAAAYARKIEAAYRRHAGRPSAKVLRVGDAGAEVTRLQEALGIPADGAFGPQTEAAVERFQERAGLVVDGIAGQKTWDALSRLRGAQPKVQETSLDRAAGRVLDYGAKLAIGSGGTLTAQTVLDRAPAGAVDLAFYGGVGLVLLLCTALAGALLLRWWRDVA